MKAAPDMVWRADRDGQCVYTSDAYAAFVGQTAESQLARGWVERIHHEDRDRVVQQVEREMAAGRPFVATFRVQAADGGFRMIRSAGRPDARHGGYVGGVYPVLHQARKAPASIVELPGCRRTRHAVTPARESCPSDEAITESLTEIM